MWSIPLTIALVGMAIAAGTDTDRGLAMLLLAPSLITYGLFPARTIFVVLYRTRQVVIVDIGVGILQSAGMISVAALGWGAPGVAGVVSATTALNAILVWLLAAREHDPASSTHYGLMRFARRAAPLGIVSIMTTIYLLIDLVIIGWYITGPSVGEYAAAAKLLTILTGVTRARDDRRAARILDPPGGPPRARADRRPRLALAGGRRPAAVRRPRPVRRPRSEGRGRRRLRRRGPPAADPVGGGDPDGRQQPARRGHGRHTGDAPDLLPERGGDHAERHRQHPALPTQGVRAAAWLTVATEVLITVAALSVIRRSTSLDETLGVSVRPILAIAIAAVPSILLIDHEILAPVVGTAVPSRRCRCCAPGPTSSGCRASCGGRREPECCSRRGTSASRRHAAHGPPARASRPPAPSGASGDLDSELRYVPVARALPDLDLPVCEVGSGPQGLAVWTDRTVIGVDPGDDERHGGLAAAGPANLRRVPGDGAHIPLPDRSVAAAVAVDTLEHIPRADRPAVVREMKRVTAPGGRVILMGPSGPAAAAADRELLERHQALGGVDGPVVWLGEHVEHGLPSVEDMVAMVGGERCTRVVVRGVFNLAMWRTRHRALLGDFPQPRGSHLVHHLMWAPFGAAARRLQRGPHYRCIVVAELGP